MRNGVCGLSFDRKDIEMNKFAVTCLEAQFHVFDARTQHPKKVRGNIRQGLGFVTMVELAKKAVCKFP